MRLRVSMLKGLPESALQRVIDELPLMDGVRISDDILTKALQRSLKLAIKNSGLRPTLVPIPHTKMATRRRGRNFVNEIANRLARLENLPIRPILQHNRRVDDQSKLDAPSRAGNLSGAMSVKGECGRPCEIILVDDLITTGVTLGEAVRTLEKSGFHVVASVTALVALPLR